MPKIKESTKAIRISQALEVYAMCQADAKLSQKKACEQVGIDPKTFRFWISQAGEAIEFFQEAVAQVERSELMNILLAKEQIQQKLIADGLKPYTEPLARLAILQYLDTRSDALSQKYRGLDNDAAKSLFSGPTLSPGESRFAPGTTPLLETEYGSDGSVTVRPVLPDVIEGETYDPVDRQPT